MTRSALRLLSVVALVPLLMPTDSRSEEVDAKNVSTKKFTIPPKVTAGSALCPTAEFIYPLEGRPTPQCHASTIEETPSGIVAAWFGGTREKAPDVGIWVSRHIEGKWSSPTEVITSSVIDGKRLPCWNPVLFQPKSGPLMLFYKVGPTPSTWWGMLTTSADDGKTWSEPRKLGTSDKLGEGNPNLLGPVKNKPIELEPGVIFCPTSSEHDGWRVHFEITRDDGKTWEVVGPIEPADTFDAIQPTLLKTGPKSLVALNRTREGVVAMTRSDDGGNTWSKLKAIDLPNPNAGFDGVTLESGRHLLVYNHTTRFSNPPGRTMLNVAVSDDGVNWTPVITLEHEGRGTEFSYPAMIETADGRVHITYTWNRKTVKHVVLDPNQIEVP